jgi:hypothetical protein
MVLLSAVIVAAVIAWTGLGIVRELAAAREARARDRTLQLLSLFAPGLAAAAEDSRALLVWQPLAATARKMFPPDFDALDQAAGGRFPFSVEQIEAAHARWSADWLGWEGTHDTEFKLKAAAIEAEIASSGASALGRARLDAVEREKLDKYQRRYEEYARVSRALRALAGSAKPG